MAALRLIDALPDFSAPSREPAAPKPVASPHPFAPPPPPAQPDVAEIVRMEVAVAEEAIRMRLEQEHQATLTVERAIHAEALAEQAERLGRDAGRMILDRLAELERSVGDHVANGVARILGGLMSEDLQKRSIDSLAAVIVESLRDAEALRIEVRGPQSMCAGLSDALGDRVVNIHYIETDGPDLSATVDGTVFETRLSQWSTVLSGILE